MLKYALMGLLAQKPRHGYDLKNAFESMLSDTWSLNIGQVYATLSRLERDGFVESEVVAQELLPDRKVYSLTTAGREELRRWLGQPTEGLVRLKDEFYIKLLLHQHVGSDGTLSLIWKQRQVYLKKLAQLTAIRSDTSLEPAAALLVEGAILHVEADLEWLDMCEERLRAS